MLQQTRLSPNARPRAIAIWLLVVAGFVIAMVAVGGITRLTESGLSITQWKPISGIIPPLNDTQWQAEFARYREIPQYRAVHPDLTLAGFKWIFFWEYIHRLLGRLIGSVFALPLLWFAVRRQIPKGYLWRLLALLALGGLQGAFGWLMVRSGLSVRTEVAPLWLATHLLTALFTLSGLIWTALDLFQLARNPLSRPAHLTRIGIVTAVVLLIQLFYGALMAGLRAGYVTAEWPLMNGEFFPVHAIAPGSIGYLLVDDPWLVHFIHRWWAWVAVAALVVFARAVRRSGNRPASIAIHSAFGIQILLGIATVMTQVDIVLAVLHQLVGALLVAVVAWGAHVLGRRQA